MRNRTVLSRRDVTAREQYICAHCGKPISIGERYRREIDRLKNGELHSFAEHIDCEAVWFDAVYMYASDRNNIPFLKDYPDLDLEEYWIRDAYPEVAERLFGKEETVNNLTAFDMLKNAEAYIRSLQDKLSLSPFEGYEILSEKFNRLANKKKSFVKIRANYLSFSCLSNDAMDLVGHMKYAAFYSHYFNNSDNETVDIFYCSSCTSRPIERPVMTICVEEEDPRFHSRIVDDKVYNVKLFQHTGDEFNKFNVSNPLYYYGHADTTEETVTYNGHIRGSVYFKMTPANS